MIQIITIVSRAKSKEVKKLALNSQLLTVQILTNAHFVSFLFYTAVNTGFCFDKIFDNKKIQSSHLDLLLHTYYIGVQSVIYTRVHLLHKIVIFECEGGCFITSKNRFVFHAIA